MPPLVTNKYSDSSSAENYDDTFFQSNSNNRPKHSFPLHYETIKQCERRRVVKFSTDSPEVHPVLGQWEISEDEKKAMWRTNVDMRRTRAEAMAFIKAKQNNGDNGKEEMDYEFEEQNSLRGLEHMKDPQYKAQRKELKATLVRLVMKEQMKQKSKGIRDDVALSKVSSTCSRWSREMGLVMAAFDEENARQTL